MNEVIELVQGHTPSKDSPFQERFEMLRTRAGMSLVDFLNAVARYIAHEFVGQRMSFELGDDIANELWGIVLSKLGDDSDLMIPDYMYDVFDAFDSGEYRRSHDAPDADPVEIYTRPALEAIVAGESKPQ